MIGEMKQVRLEKWEQPKGPTGSLEDAKPDQFNVWAEVRRTGGGRSYENSQTKMSEGIEFKLWFRSNWKPNGLWKIIYRGKSFTIRDIERIDEKRFNWLVKAESK